MWSPESRVLPVQSLQREIPRLSWDGGQSSGDPAGIGSLLQQACKQPCIQPICTLYRPGTSISPAFLSFCCPNQLAPWSFYWLQAIGFQCCPVSWVSYHLSICLLASKMLMTSFNGCNFPLSFSYCYGFRFFCKNPITVILVGALGETLEVHVCASSFHGQLKVFYPFFSFNK